MSTLWHWVVTVTILAGIAVFAVVTQWWNLLAFPATYLVLYAGAWWYLHRPMRDGDG